MPRTKYRWLNRVSPTGIVEAICEDLTSGGRQMDPLTAANRRGVWGTPAAARPDEECPAFETDPRNQFTLTGMEFPVGTTAQP